jgi:cathepsin C
MPTHEKNAYLVLPDESFKKDILVDLNLDDSSVITLDGKTIKGKWTMVYNEGFDILAEGYSFFTFSKYASDIKMGKKWQSLCYSSLVGFYHNGNGDWGCFYAEKQGVDHNQITNGDVKDKLKVVEGTVQKIAKMRFKEENNFFDNVNFLQSNEKETLFLHSKFKDHAKVVEKINKMNGLWTAKNYDEYTNLTIEELNNLAGKRRHAHKSLFSEKRKAKRSTSTSNSVFDMSNFLRKRNDKEKDTDFPEFPKNYLDNMKHMNVAKNQGSCGSCFAVAAMNMLEARLSRFFSIKEKLSIQHILSCSVYNQGCDGGYAYLSLKFGNEVELVPENCMKYKANYH